MLVKRAMTTPAKARLLSGEVSWKHWLLALSSALFLLVSLAAPVAARALHAQYDHSNPAANARLPGGQPPAFVEVWFTEQIEPAFSSLQVYNRDRQRVDNKDSHGVANDPYALLVTLHPQLPDGAYTVVFSNVSAEDGHHVKSNFSFVVGAGPLPGNTNDLLNASSALDENFSFWSIALRWLNYLGMDALVGVAAFLLLVWQPALRLAAQSIALETIHKASSSMEKRATSLVCIAIVVLLCGWVAFLLYQSRIDSGLTVWSLFNSRALGATLFQSHFGTVWLIRLALIVGAMLCWVYWLRHPTALHTQGKQVPRTTLWLLLLLGAGLMLTTSLNSHAAASADAWFLLPADQVHLLSTGLWIGGLLLLVSGLVAVWRVVLPGTGDRTRLLAVLIPRFSRLALISVLLLVLTGTLQAIIQVGTLNALFTTNYGQALCLKIGIFFVTICLGAFHLLRVSPHMRSFSRNNSEEDGASSLGAGTLQRTFRRTVGVEAGLAVLVLVVVGGMTSLSPPPPPQQYSTQTSFSGPFIQRGQSNNLSYTLVINPGTVGPNTFEVDVRDASGKPISDAEAVTLRFLMLDMEMGVQDVQLQPVASTPGRYSGTASVVGMSGHWRILLLIQRNGYDDVRIPIPFTAP